MTKPATVADVTQRLARLELTVESLQRSIDVQTQRVMAVQAQMDHLEARRDRQR